MSKNSRIEIVKGDIVKQDLDVVVNAANSSLLGGGGVDGAVHRAAGKQLAIYCRNLHGCKTGQAKISPGFNLKAPWIVHTVGPVYRGGQNKEPELLASCYTESLKLAAEKQANRVGFPAISTGIYNYPIEAATHIALTTTKAWLDTNEHPKTVVFIAFSDQDYEVYQKALTKLSLP